MSNILPPEYTRTSPPLTPVFVPAMPLDRIATAMERLADARTPDATEAVLEWLSRLNAEELDDAVMRRQKLGTPVMHNVLEVLKEWAANDGA